MYYPHNTKKHKEIKIHNIFCLYIIEHFGLTEELSNLGLKSFCKFTSSNICSYLDWQNSESLSNLYYLLDDADVSSF